MQAAAEGQVLQDAAGLSAATHSSSGMSGQRSSSFPGFSLPLVAAGTAPSTIQPPNGASAVLSQFGGKGPHAEEHGSKSHPCSSLRATELSLSALQQQPQHSQQQELDRLLAGLTPADAASLVAAAAAAMSNGDKLDWLLPILQAVQQHRQADPPQQGQEQQQRQDQQQPQELLQANRLGQQQLQQQPPTVPNALESSFSFGMSTQAEGRTAPGLLPARPSLSSLLPATAAMAPPAEASWRVHDPLSMQSSGLQHIVRQIEQQQQHVQQRVQQHGQQLLPKSSSSSSGSRRKKGLAEAGSSTAGQRQAGGPLLPASGSSAAAGAAAAAAGPTLPALAGMSVALPVSSGLLPPGTSSLPSSMGHLDAGALQQQMQTQAAAQDAVKPAAAPDTDPAVIAAASKRPSSAPPASMTAAAAAAGAATHKHSSLAYRGAPAAAAASPAAAPGPLAPTGGSTGSAGGGVAGPLKKSSGSRAGSHQSNSAARFMWTPELHQLFLSAVEELGGEEAATPAEILTRMAVDGLSRDNVKSHLQRHRQNMREQRLLQQLQQQHGLPPASNSAPAVLNMPASAGGEPVSAAFALHPASASASAATTGAQAALQQYSESAAPGVSTPSGSPTAPQAAAAAGQGGGASLQPSRTASPSHSQQQQHGAGLTAVSALQWASKRRSSDADAPADAAAAAAAAAAAGRPRELQGSGPTSPARVQGRVTPSGTAGLVVQVSPRQKRAPKRSLTADVLMTGGAGGQHQAAARKGLGPDVVAEAAEAAAAEATAAANAAAAAASAASASAASLPGISGTLSDLWRQQQQQQQVLYGSCPDLGMLAATAASGGALPGSSPDLRQGNLPNAQDPAAAAATPAADVTLVFDQRLAHRSKRRGGAATAWDDGLQSTGSGAAGASPASPKGWWSSSSSARAVHAMLPASPFETATQLQGTGGSQGQLQDQGSLHMEPSLAHMQQQQQAAAAAAAGGAAAVNRRRPRSGSKQQASDGPPPKRAPRTVASKSSSRAARGQGEAVAQEEVEDAFGLELLSEVALLDEAEAQQQLGQQQQQQAAMLQHIPAVHEQQGRAPRPRGRAVKRRSDPGASAKVLDWSNTSAAAAAAPNAEPAALDAAPSLFGSTAGMELASMDMQAAAQIFGLAAAAAAAARTAEEASGQEPAMGIPLMPPAKNGSSGAGQASLGGGNKGAAAAADDVTATAARKTPPPARGLPVSFQVVPALPVPSSHTAQTLPPIPMALAAAATAAAAAAAAPPGIQSESREATAAAAAAVGPAAQDGGGAVSSPPSSPAPAAAADAVGQEVLTSTPSVLSPASRAHQAEAAAAAVAAAVTAGPVDLVLCNSTTALLSAVLAPLDPASRACLAAVLQLLTLQGVISWHDPPLQGPIGPPAELTALLQAFMAQAAAQHGVMGLPVPGVSTQQQQQQPPSPEPQ